MSDSASSLYHSAERYLFRVTHAFTNGRPLHGALIHSPVLAERGSESGPGSLRLFPVPCSPFPAFSLAVGALGLRGLWLFTKQSGQELHGAIGGEQINTQRLR